MEAGLLKLLVMKNHFNCRTARMAGPALLLFLALPMAPPLAPAQAPAAAVPDWALPSSPTNVQIPPPADFHRQSRIFETPVGIFDGQSDIGAALVEGSGSYDAVTKRYTVRSAGYNIWYQRDEFRLMWKKMSGDVSLAADVLFPDAGGYGDRKAVLVVR